MNKCTNCGTEFDGNFCPQCGQKRAGEITCPHCGNKVANDANFCLMCGQRIVHPPEDDNKVKTKQKDNGTDRSAFAARMFGILRYVPMALTLLFAVLLPLLYIAPIAEASEMMGAAEKVNVYSLDEDFYGVSVAYLVFMVLALLFAVVLLYLHINKDKRNKYITLFGRVRITVGELASLLAVVLVYLPCIIISAVAMSNAAELNELLGGGLMEAVSAGASPKAVLSFAVIFIVFAIGAVVARILIAKANPELLPVDEDDEQIEVKPCRKPLLYHAFLNTNLRRAVLAFFVCSFITAVALTICFGGFILDGHTITSPHVIIIVGACVTVLAVIFSFTSNVDWSPEEFIHTVKKKNRDDESKLGIKKTIIFIVPLGLYIYFYSFIINAIASIGRGYILSFVYIIVSVIIYIVAKIVIVKQSGEIARYLYGIAGPSCDMSLRIEFDEERELEAYDAYILAKKHGVAIADGEYTKKKTLIRRIVLSLASFIFAAMTIVSAVVSPHLVDKFSASYMSNLVDDFKDNAYVDYNIESCLGKPNDISDITDDSFIWIYYSDDYVDIKEKKDNLEKQLEQAYETSDIKNITNISAELQTLKTKAANLVFNSLTIYIKCGSYDDVHRRSGGVYTGYRTSLVKLVLNTCAQIGDKSSQKKTAKSVELFGAKYNERGYTSDNFYVEIFYTDGSYKYEPVPTSEFSEIDFTKKGSQTVKWSDEWGTYSATVKSE